MGEANRVPPGETAQVRIVAPGNLAASGAPAAAAARLLGLAGLVEGEVERLKLADLAGLGLAGYLSEGWDVPGAAMAADRARLEALRGEVFLVRSGAFGGRRAELAPLPGVEILGPYPEARAPGAVPLPPRPEEPAVLKPPPQPAPPPGTPRVPLALLALVSLPVLALLIWWLT